MCLCMCRDDVLAAVSKHFSLQPRADAAPTAPEASADALDDNFVMVRFCCFFFFLCSFIGW